MVLGPTECLRFRELNESYDESNGGCVCGAIRCVFYFTRCLELGGEPPSMIQLARGDKRSAMKRLRAGAYSRSHHLSTFRSGLLLGISLPALVAGLYQSAYYVRPATALVLGTPLVKPVSFLFPGFQQPTRTAIQGWDALLFIYSVFFVPVVFALLVGLNLLVWSRSRINYTFIFGANLELLKFTFQLKI
jgi:hypothetical protein